MAAEHEWRIIVPTVDNAGYAVKDEALERIAQEMAEWFGGVTVYPVAGCYAEEQTRRLHCDPNIVIASSELEGHARPSEHATEAFMSRLAHQVGEDLGQHYVYEQETTSDYTQWVPGRYQEHLPASRLDLSLPKIHQQEVLAAILPARFRNR